MRMGYRVAAAAFTMGLIAFVLGALFHPASGALVLGSGVLFAISGLMVWFNVGFAGSDMVAMRRRWMRRLMPWIVPAKQNDRAIMTFTGLLAIGAGIALAVIGVALIVGHL
jgi:uncharacterized membrane protein YphA (DoxX/SURF4 family)